MVAFELELFGVGILLGEIRPEVIRHLFLSLPRRFKPISIGIQRQSFSPHGFLPSGYGCHFTDVSQMDNTVKCVRLNELEHQGDGIWFMAKGWRVKRFSILHWGLEMSVRND